MKRTDIIVRTCCGLLFAAFVVTTTGQATASGAAMDARDLSPKTVSDLRVEIDKARVATPELFRQLRDIAARARELDAAARKPGIPLTMQLKPLGPRAFYPMIELLVFDAHTEKDLPSTAQSALRIGLIEAVGSIRDARAIPVLAKTLESRDLETVRASAQGLGRIGTDEAFGVIKDAAKAAARGSLNERERERAILDGMHDCRREAAARFLADRLRQHPDPETARVIAKSLGGVGNAWAWKTLSSQTEAGATRTTAAEALVLAFVAYEGDVRDAAAKALLVVDEPITPTIIAKAKSTAPRDVGVALDVLADRFAKNPTRMP